MTLGVPEPGNLPQPADIPEHELRSWRGRFRYSRWDGTQRLPDLAADEILDALSDDLMAEGDLSDALRRLFQRGLRAGRPGSDQEGIAGLREMLARLAQRRRELLDRYQLGDVLGDVREELDEIVAGERRGIERRLAEVQSQPDDNNELRRMVADMAARREAALDALPQDAGGRIRGLQEYDFLEPSARERFDTLLERLRKQMLDTYFNGLSDQIKGMTPESLAANREMVRDLNRLLQERLEGRDPDISEFLANHGEFFPGAETLDDIVEQLAERMAVMQSLLASMSPEQRAELQSMMDALLRDDRLRWDLAQLASILDQLLPGGLGERLSFRGDEPLTLESALHQMGRLQRMDSLAEELAGADAPGALADIDLDEVNELIDEESAGDVRALQQLAKQLEDAGYVERKGKRLELTPRGVRRIGQRVLDDLFARLRRDAFGGHAIREGGSGGERADESIAYEFGRPFQLDLQRTLANALAREENSLARRSAGGTTRTALQLAPEDFAVYQTEELSTASTVLLVDMSRSMLLRGCFLAAKKVAVALDTLIRTQFPRDELHVIGFAYYAREIRPGALAGLSWHGYEYGTNLQHGLMLARQILARAHGRNREIVVITDGEPTAHFEDGQVQFSYPPTRRTLQETLREVGRCTREGITINTFMLERSRALAEFVEKMTRLNRGRAFYATPERLGEYVLVDYVGKKTRRT
jgi:uncharacterized protein with von Willebrand factor type A (vWA) domain